jgi:BA14K-like protein
MEPTMISLKVLRTAAAIALLLPLVAPTASVAQNPNGSKANSARPSGVHPGAGGVRPGAGGMRPSGGVQAGAGYHGGYHNGGGGAVIPGAIAGAVVGGAIASQVYGGPAYVGPGYDGPSADYYDDSAAAGPPPGDNDGVAYCMQTYRSYDPQSGTYLGNDGQRHPCP